MRASVEPCVPHRVRNYPHPCGSRSATCCVRRLTPSRPLRRRISSIENGLRRLLAPGPLIAVGDVHQWPPEFIEAYRQAWQEVAAEEAAADPRFKEIYDSYTAFRQNYAKWREIAYLKE